MRTPLSSFCTVGVALAITVPGAAQSLLQLSGQVLLADGGAIPGVPGAVAGGVGTVDSPVVDLAGRVLFRARFTGPVTNEVDDRAYFVGFANGDLRMLLRGNDPDPSGTWPGATLVQTLSPGSFASGLSASPRLSAENGIYLFAAHLSGGGIQSTGTTLAGRNDSVLYWGQPGNWLILAQQGGLAPVGMATLDTLDFPNTPYQQMALNSSGFTCFVAALVGGDVTGTPALNAAVLLAGVPGALQSVLRGGDVVFSGQVIGGLGNNHQINASGQVLHDASLDLVQGSPPATFNDAACVFVWTPGLGNQVLMRQGDPAPGTGGAVYGVPALAQGFGNSGRTAFATNLSGTGVTPGVNDQGLFIGSPGNVQLISRKRDPAPGLPAGVLMNVVNANLSYSDFQGGTVAFYATVTGTGVTAQSDSSFWIGNANGLTLLCREGDPAPGWSNAPNYVSATFGPIAAGACMINERGQVVLSGVQVRLETLDPVTMTPVLTLLGGNHYSWDPTLGLALSWGLGDRFPTAAGTLASNGASFVRFPSGDDTMLGLSDNGDLVVHVDLTAGAAIVRGHLGALVATPSAIDAAAGGTQDLAIDVGPAHGNSLYVVLGSMTGTRPGFQSPLGPQVIPLNFDAWTQLSLALANSIIYPNSLSLTDPQGRALAGFHLPPGFTSLAGLTLHHAVTVLDIATLQSTFVSEPAGLHLY